MPMGRPLPPPSIGQEQRKQLVSWSQRRRCPIRASPGWENSVHARQLTPEI